MVATSTPKNGTADPGEKRARAAFPRLSLQKALELPQAIVELDSGDEVNRLILFRRLRKSPDSGHSRTLITASSGAYRLTEGGYQADRLRITSLGKRIVTAASESEKYRAAHDILFSNEIFASFIRRFAGKSVPNDEIAVDFLMTHHKL